MNSDYYQPRHSLHQGRFINDGFFPDLDLEKLQKRFRIDSSLDVSALFDTVLQAVILTNSELYSFACQKHEQGYETLAAVPTPGYRFETLSPELPAPPEPPAPVITAADDEDTEEDAKEGEPEPESYLVALYQNAIFYRVKGDLTRENSHQTMSKDGTNRQKQYHNISSDFYRQSVWAVRMIKGRRTSRVRLL